MRWLQRALPHSRSNDSDSCPAIKKYLAEETLKIKAGTNTTQAKPKKRGKKQFKSAETVVEDEEPGEQLKQKRVKKSKVRSWDPMMHRRMDRE